jgi:hypothetical protein
MSKLLSFTSSLLLIGLTGCLALPTAHSATPTSDFEAVVYFTSTLRYTLSTPPYEVPVARSFPAGASFPEAVLDQFFTGPTEEERALGYEAITSGFTGYSQIEVHNGTAHLYLEGLCSSSGATYTIAQPLMANLLQFPDIRYVKIYDSDGETGQPDEPGNSIPICLEP